MLSIFLVNIALVPACGSELTQQAYPTINLTMMFRLARGVTVYFRCLGILGGKMTKPDQCNTCGFVFRIVLAHRLLIIEGVVSVVRSEICEIMNHIALVPACSTYLNYFCC